MVAMRAERIAADWAPLTWADVLRQSTGMRRMRKSAAVTDAKNVFAAGGQSTVSRKASAPALEKVSPKRASGAA